jgi:hypothetical protein
MPVKARLSSANNVDSQLKPLMLLGLFGIVAVAERRAKAAVARPLLAGCY